MDGNGSIKTFGDKGTEDIYNGINSKRARKTIPLELHSKAQEILDRLNACQHPMDLTIHDPKSLEGYENWYSLRINRQYRIVFIWVEGEAYEVQAGDYH